ncbi:unnamed protein product [Nesidiocoris tenuis]|uniref:U2A'/phosphoprotein 32 family A C-terminal domain-containing protein n=1 Tax=Nesidiocoris tenuis TaxID=355587 RepID=A0A6H5GI11_9HEMI|nr:unnamed protein product [Nesidiocoris tenuis]
MTVLTEEMVFARTKTNNLSAITKLNCWGSQLSDVKLLRRMTNVQVLSLSVNNIESLEDMQYCTKLQDLFVRKNNITDLNEVCYLKDLAHLRNLWLGDNPCANEEGTIFIYHTLQWFLSVSAGYCRYASKCEWFGLAVFGAVRTPQAGQGASGRNSPCWWPTDECTMPRTRSWRPCWVPVSRNTSQPASQWKTFRRLCTGTIPSVPLLKASETLKQPPTPYK